MCGRTACSLDPDGICKGCAYKDNNGKLQKPVWKNPQNGKSFFPSYNIAPGQYTPVMISSQHYQDTAAENESETKRIIQPMRWGLVPSWHKGNPDGIGYQTNNCKSETMLEKKMFKVPLEKGRRCVVLAEGYYEWKKSGQIKQPYFITQQVGDMKPDMKMDTEDVKDEDLATKLSPKCEVKSEDDEQKEIKESDSDETPSKPLMKMAGVFDICKSKDVKDENLYSYTVITVAASTATAHIHHRMPAILSTEEEIEQWLDFGSVPIAEAVKIIKPQECIDLHPVSTVVNNSRNNTPACIKTIDGKKSKTALENWLKRVAPKKELEEITQPNFTKKELKEEDDESEIPAKKMKQEE